MTNCQADDPSWIAFADPAEGERIQALVGELLQLIKLLAPELLRTDPESRDIDRLYADCDLPRDTCDWQRLIDAETNEAWHRSIRKYLPFLFWHVLDCGVFPGHQASLFSTLGYRIDRGAWTDSEREQIHRCLESFWRHCIVRPCCIFDTTNRPDRIWSHFDYPDTLLDWVGGFGYSTFGIGLPQIFEFWGREVGFVPSLHLLKAYLRDYRRLRERGVSCIANDVLTKADMERFDALLQEVADGLRRREGARWETLQREPCVAPIVELFALL